VIKVYLVDDHSVVIEVIYPLLQQEKGIEISGFAVNGQIAALLFLSIDTINTHRKSLHNKLEVKNTAMLIRYAVENQLV
jgi:DNA-binding NarL/FixJ family response regulator